MCNTSKQYSKKHNIRIFYLYLHKAGLNSIMQTVWSLDVVKVNLAKIVLCFSLKFTKI